VIGLATEIRDFGPDSPKTSAGLRIEFWLRSIGFIATAPVFGHGTGSISAQFRQAAADQTDVKGGTSTNPHNQTFAVAIQLGLVGTAVLFAMWLSHLLLFRGAGMLAWVGLVIVFQNIVGSLFNSHLFDFTHGWAYVIGFGVAAGTVLRRQNASWP
jgi:O-antigen ligase